MKRTMICPDLDFDGEFHELECVGTTIAELLDSLQPDHGDLVRKIRNADGQYLCVFFSGGRVVSPTEMLTDDQYVITCGGLFYGG